MKHRCSQQCNIAYSSQLFDHSHLNRKSLKMLLAEFAHLCSVSWRKREEKKNGCTWENSMKRRLDAVFLFFHCSFHKVTPTFYSLAWNTGIFGTWYMLLLVFSEWCSLTEWQSCDTSLLNQKVFCFLFISLALSQDFIKGWSQKGKEGQKRRLK